MSSTDIDHTYIPPFTSLTVPCGGSFLRKWSGDAAPLPRRVPQRPQQHDATALRITSDLRYEMMLTWRTVKEMLGEEYVTLKILVAGNLLRTEMSQFCGKVWLQKILPQEILSAKILALCILREFSLLFRKRDSKKSLPIPSYLLRFLRLQAASGRNFRWASHLRPVVLCGHARFRFNGQAAQLPLCGMCVFLVLIFLIHISCFLFLYCFGLAYVLL